MSATQQSSSFCITAFNTFVVVVALGNFLIMVGGSPCPWGHYTNPRYTIDGSTKCLPCTTCPLGSGARRQCTAWGDTECEPCTLGFTYSSNSRGGVYCRPCTLCGPHRKVERQCSLTQDTVCGECDIGFYWNSISYRCEPCSWCFPDLMQESNRYFVTQCHRAEIPKDFRCAQRRIPPYNPPVWNFPVKKASFHEEEEDEQKIESGGNDEDNYSGSGQYGLDHEDFPTDDEQIDEDGDDEDVTSQGSRRHETQFARSETSVAPSGTFAAPSGTDRTRASSSPSAQTFPVDESEIFNQGSENDPSDFLEILKPAPMWGNIHYTEEEEEETVSAGARASHASAPDQESVNFDLLIAVVGLAVLTLSLVCAMFLLSQRYMMLKRRSNDVMNNSFTECNVSMDDQYLLSNTKVHS
ncbi:unnamed protein product [Clavelina lepadiformis]|uniref:TNFR-Cys domain-containing protein n=1 Tax=Clavelina lepadiformis TaxID=159417 RepID=A0ABP0G3V8_CLALP